MRRAGDQCPGESRRLLPNGSLRQPNIPKSNVVNAVQLLEASQTLHLGGVIAYPTEAVWGLGCDPDNARACLRLLDLKQRSWSKGLILVASEIEQLENYVSSSIDRSAWDRAAESWPGPATWIFPCSASAPPWITGNRQSIALRVSAHPIVHALCKRFGGAIVSTSANRATRPPARSATQVRLEFADALDMIVPGPLGSQDRPTPIRDVMTGESLRT